MRRLTLNKAIAEGVMQEMERDDKVVLIGEDITSMGGGLSVFLGVAEANPGKVVDMPIAESGFANFGVGAAVAGMKPVIDLQFSDFIGLAYDAIANSAAKLRFNSLGSMKCPVTYVMGNGAGFGAGCVHSQSTESWLMNVPGLKIVVPSNPYDAKGLLKASIQDEDPVVFYFPEGSTAMKGDVPEEDYTIPLNNAGKVTREGSDVTIVAIQQMNKKAAKAAKALAKEGIEVEIIDPRVLIPFDKETLFKSVRKTGRLIIVHEAPVRGGIGGEIAAMAAESCFEDLKAPVKRVGSLNYPIPSGPMEEFLFPQVDDIINAVKEVCGKK